MSGRRHANPDSSGGAPDGQAIDEQGRLADTCRNALAALAANTHALVQRKVVADALDPRKHGRAVANERSAFDRLGDLSASDAVGFGAGEDELAAGDVDLASAEALGVDAVLDPFDEIRGMGACAKLSRLPLPVASIPISRAFRRSCR